MFLLVGRSNLSHVYKGCVVISPLFANVAEIWENQHFFQAHIPEKNAFPPRLGPLGPSERPPCWPTPPPRLEDPRAFCLNPRVISRGSSI